MDKKIIKGMEVSDVHIELNDAPVTSCVWFKINGSQTLAWLKKANDGAFWVERRYPLQIIDVHGTVVAVYDEFLDELYDYLDEIVLEQSQEAMNNDPACYELRFCEYGHMPQVGCAGSTLDVCISCAQKIEELEFLMREQSPLRRERYYIAQCVTHEVLERF